MAIKATALYGGIDWLTITVPYEHSAGEAWLEVCLGVMDKIAEEGNILKHRTLQGYYGISAGNCFAGSRDDGYMCVLTGSHANDYYTTVYRHFGHISRLDVQATVQYEEEQYGIAQDAFNDWHNGSEHLRTNRKLGVILITDGKGGDTVYIGSKSSEHFA